MRYNTNNKMRIQFALFMLIYFSLGSLSAQEIIGGKEVRTGAWEGRQVEYLEGEIAIILKPGVSQAEGSLPQLWVMDSNGGNPIQLTQDGGWAADWSPDGHFIVFTNPADGRLWIMDADGSNWRQLTFEP